MRLLKLMQMGVCAEPSSQPFALSDFPGLYFHLDALTQAQFNGGSITDGTLVSSWVEAFGLSFDQGTSARRPTYVADSGDGYPGVDFQNKQLPGSFTDFLLTVGTPFSLFFVLRPTSLGVEDIFFAIATAQGATSPWVEMRNGVLGFQGNGTWKSWKATGTPLVVNTTNYFVITYNGGTASDIANYALYLNGAQLSLTSSADDASGTKTVVGSYTENPSPPYCMNGYIKEVALWTSTDAGTPTGLADLTLYCARWGL